MVTVKLQLNSIISIKGACYCTIDLKDLYLMTPISCPEYMRMKLKDLPEDSVLLNNLVNKVTSNRLCQKGMYGLPQAGILAQEIIEKCLNQHGYCQSSLTRGLCQHDYRLISFTLCVEHFGIKYVGREHAEHLASVFSKHYKCSNKWDGQQYLSMNIGWDYTEGTVHVSMLGYVPEALSQFQHKPPRIPQLQPYPHVKPAYGAKAQYTEVVNTTLLLDKEGQKYMQVVIGTFLYYIRCVDSIMLPARGSLTTQQANLTQNTHQFLDYITTHPDAIITYRASDMVLVGHSNASYLFGNQCMQQSRRTLFHMSNNNLIPNNIGLILTISRFIIKAVMSSAVSDRGRDWHSLHQLPESHPCMKHT